MNINRKYFIGVRFTLLIVVTATLAQEPFSYQPEDIPKEEIPEGMTAKEYIDSVYWERHGKIKITFHVTGEDGKPISDADVNVGFDSLLHNDGYNNYYGKTDKDGMYTVEGRGQGSSQIIITKENYYPSMPKVNWDYELNPDLETIHRNGGYQPWNPTVEVTLKKVEKPIPMLVRLASGGAKSWMNPTKLQLNKKIGWDLIIGDWINPYGKGKIADLIIEFSSDYQDDECFSKAIITFGNEDDGVIKINELLHAESQLKFPRMAPRRGYDVKSLTYKKLYKMIPTRGIPMGSSLPNNPPIGYFIRIRTQKNSNGEITSALYGKIIRPFKIYLPNATYQLPVLNLDYYLNLTLNDRNLEFDPAKNLAPEVDKRLRWDP